MCWRGRMSGVGKEVVAVEKCLYVAEDPLRLRARPSFLPDPPPPASPDFQPPFFAVHTPFPPSLTVYSVLLNMLEAFEILTTSGVVLWSKSYAPVGAHVVNSLINDVFIEEKVVPQGASSTGVSPAFKKEKYTLKWKRVEEFNLIFVVSAPIAHGFLS